MMKISATSLDSILFLPPGYWGIRFCVALTLSSTKNLDRR